MIKPPAALLAAGLALGLPWSGPAVAQASQPSNLPVVSVTPDPTGPHTGEYCRGWNDREAQADKMLQFVLKVITKTGYINTPEGGAVFVQMQQAVEAAEPCRVTEP